MTAMLLCCDSLMSSKKNNRLVLPILEHASNPQCHLLHPSDLSKPSQLPHIYHADQLPPLLPYRFALSLLGFDYLFLLLFFGPFLFSFTPPYAFTDSHTLTLQLPPTVAAFGNYHPHIHNHPFVVGDPHISVRLPLEARPVTLVVGSRPSTRILHSTVTVVQYQRSWINRTSQGSLAPLGVNFISLIGEVRLSLPL